MKGLVAVDGITPYIIVTGETVTINTDEQLNITEKYIIEGIGFLEVNGDGLLNISDGPNTGEQDAIFTVADEIKLDGIESSADVTDAVNVGISIHGVANKAIPINTDKVPSIDTADSNTLKTSTWTNIKVFLKTYFDTLYNKYAHPNHTGAVTSTGDGATAITDKAVILSKMADMATASLLGRNTATTGTPEVLSKTTALSLLNVEDGSTADQSDAEIKTAYENNANTNVFTDTEQTKLAGIESGADITDATNVNVAGATMNTDADVSDNSWILDEDTLASDDATKVPTQQSVKAYVDNSGGGGGDNKIMNSGYWATSRSSTLSTTGSAVLEDDCANDDTADWTKSDCTLVFDTDHYEIDPSSVWTNISITATGLKPGHLYRVGVDLKDGTSASVTIRFHTDGYSSSYKTTTASWVTNYSSYWSPDGTSATLYIQIPTDPGGNIEMKNFALYEYTSRFTSTYGADWHRITSTITAERVCEDYTHCRGFYGMKLTKGANTAEYYTFSRATYNAPWFAWAVGMDVVAGLYIYSISAADNVKLQITDSNGTTSSVFVAANTLTWVEITKACATDISSFDVRVLLDGDSGDVCYISPVKVQAGKTIGTGNWSHPINEIIPFETWVASDWFDATGGWSDTNSYREPQGDSSGAISAQCVAVMASISVHDSGSASIISRCNFGPGTSLSATFYISLNGIVNNAPRTEVGWIYLDYNEYFYYSINASSSATFDFDDFSYKGIMVR
jgi:hypothetical protein